MPLLIYLQFLILRIWSSCRWAYTISLCTWTQSGLLAPLLCLLVTLLLFCGFRHPDWFGLTFPWPWSALTTSSTISLWMYLLQFFLGIVTLLNHGFIADEYPTQKTSTSTSFGTCTLVLSQDWHQTFDLHPVARIASNSQIASLSRPCPPSQDLHGGSGVLCVELSLRTALWQEACALSRLQRSLDTWDTAFECAQIPKSVCSTNWQFDRLVVGMASRGLQEGPRKQAETAKALDEECQCKSTCCERQRQRSTFGRSFSICPQCCFSLAFGGNYHYHSFAISAVTVGAIGDYADFGGCGTGPCCPCRVSGSHQSTSQHSKCSGQSREATDPKATSFRPSQDVQCCESSFQGAQSLTRCENQASRTLVEAPSGFRELLGTAVETLFRAAVQLPESYPESTTRPWHSPSNFGRPQSEGRRRCRIRHCARGSKHWRHRSHESGPASADGSPSMCQSCQQSGDHGGLRRRSTGTHLKAAKIIGAVWWACQTWCLSEGSDPLCLKCENRVRVPHSNNPQLAEGADAYFALWQSAACTDAASASFLCMATACHSAIWDTNFFFQDTFTALGNALLLQGEVLLSLDRGPWLQMTSKSDSPATLQPLLSILCGTRQKARQFKVRFQGNLDALHPDGSKSVEPLNVSIADLDDTDFHSLMARAPSSQDALARSDTESDAEIHTPTSPSSLHDPHDQRQWRSIQIYDLRANHARGRIQVLPAAAAFIEARRLLGYTHHEVAEIFTISPPPIDLARLHVQPLLLIGHGDLRFGDNRIAVLIDVELHGPDFDSVIETDRYTTLLPDTVTRDFLLRIVGVNSYCQLQSDKCLAWLRGQLLPQQSNRAYQLQHGDYVRIAVPPFDQPPVSTHFAVRACQAGFSRDELIQHYELHGPDADSFHTAITNEQDDPRDEEDAQGLWQTNLCHRFREIPAFLQGPTVGALKLDSDPPHLPSFVVNVEESDHQQVQRGLEDIPRPFLDMHSALLNKAAIACEEEGPVAFIDTWFLSGTRPFVTEHSRTLRVDQHLEDWERRLRHLWHDTIDPTSPITFHWVWPVPRELPLRQRLGHLLITQNVANHIVPVHLTIHFAGTRRDAIGFAAALLSTPVEFKATRDLLQLARVCLHRLCQLRWSDRIWQANDRIHVPAGTGLDFFLGTPVARIGDEHGGEPAALAVDMVPNALEELPAPVHPPLEEFSPFIQNLYDAWLNLAVDGPGGLEAVLRVETWFLESGYIRHNDEHRDVVLGEDFWNWELTFQRRWQDMINPAVDVDYVLVTPTPVTASSPTEIHLILSQLVREFECPSIVTTYDNGVLQGRPYTAAILLPAAVRCRDIISHTGKTLFCPPHAPTTVCTCWHDGHELHTVERFPNRNGFAFILTVHRQFPRQQPQFWQDEEADTLPDPTAASSFMQLHAQVTSSVPHNPAEASSISSWERPTAELVAHTQRPQGTKTQPVNLTLATLIEPPTFITIDFQQAVDVRTQILQWPLGVVQSAASVVKWHETTQHAFSTTPSWQQEPPSGISFYTDGSAAQLQGHRHSAAAVILIVHTRHGDRFGGFRCFDTSQVGSAPHAEAAALMTAVLWASQLANYATNMTAQPTGTWVSTMIAFLRGKQRKDSGKRMFIKPCITQLAPWYNGLNIASTFTLRGNMYQRTRGILGTKQPTQLLGQPSHNGFQLRTFSPSNSVSVKTLRANGFGC